MSKIPKLLQSVALPVTCSDLELLSKFQLMTQWYTPLPFPLQVIKVNMSKLVITDGAPCLSYSAFSKEGQEFIHRALNSCKEVGTGSKVEYVDIMRACHTLVGSLERMNQ